MGYYCVRYQSLKEDNRDQMPATSLDPADERKLTDPDSEVKK